VIRSINKMRTGALILFLTFIGVVVYVNNVKFKKTLRVAFPVRQPASSYEPTNIKSAYEYIFLENIFSPLVEVSANGSIEPGVAEKAEWVGDELRLTIRKNLKTNLGKEITVEDVVFSLKRVLVLTGNTHGNFGDIVCPGQVLKNVEEVCSGIRIDGNQIFLNAKGKKSFLLPMLTAIDFAVIPKSSVDPKTLKIIDYSETSGPYFVDSDDENGNIALGLNPSHYFASPNIAEKIILVPMNPKIKGESLTAFENGLVDHLTTVDSAKAEELIEFSQKNPDYERHITLKIRSLILVFTERGRNQFSPEERRFLGQKLKKAFLKIYEGVPGFESRSEFFPSLGDGGLTSSQAAQLAELNGKTKKSSSKFKLGLLRAADLNDWTKVISEELPQAECYRELSTPELRHDIEADAMPAAYIAWTDSAFTEDIGLISYALNAGQLGLSKLERSKWLSEYMAIDDKSVRIQILKKLHFQALSSATLVPLMASPYAALARKPWRMELSTLYANNQLWRIKLH
jgi:MarR-like DNA-binding transcriptional regulator SgrR of sgrS sRNA